jgi:hypothetical protein
VAIILDPLHIFVIAHLSYLRLQDLHDSKRHSAGRCDRAAERYSRGWGRNQFRYSPVQGIGPERGQSQDTVTATACCVGGADQERRTERSPNSMEPLKP